MNQHNYLGILILREFLDDIYLNEHHGQITASRNLLLENFNV